MTTTTTLMETKILVFSPKLVILLLFSLSAFPSPSSSSLAFNFYGASCPSAEFIVKNTVRSASSFDPTIPGKLLRLLFHDCMVEVANPLNQDQNSTVRKVKLQRWCKAEEDNIRGCDASVLLQGNDTERSDPANASLGGFSVINSAKRVLEIFCPETVSCADVLALAARDAVEMAGGPAIQIPTGRRDGRASMASVVRFNIIDTSFTMDEMMKLFSSKGLSLDDLVILSGAHTIGSSHCSAFSDRFQADSKGKLTPIDSSIDKAYANELTKKCPTGASSSVTVNNDPETSFLFDNQYYRNLMAQRGLFQSDSVLFTDKRTKKMVEDLANDQNAFFERWAQSFLKLTIIGVKSDGEGEIRRSCEVANG